DRRMRINLGIRRRLAPLMGNDRRKIELMNGLLFSLPGTPVVYYGDEIGMGDNVFLGDRDGVRTPMQWSPDRNGGFSRADPPQLYLPPLMDPIYGYGALNVEAQARSPASLLNWSRRIIAVRQAQRAFGRGSIAFLYPGNRKVLAYVREFEDEVILCVFNLSRAAQAVELDLSRFKGRVPIELTGRNPFPPIGDLYYLLTLPAYGFYWFLLASEAAVPVWHEQTPEITPDFVTLVARDGLSDIVRPPARALFEQEILPSFLPKQRWFAAKEDRIASTRLCAAAPFSRDLLLAELEVMLASGATQRYFLPLALAREESEGPGLALLPYALARVRRKQELWTLVDASAVESCTRALIDGLRTNRELFTAEDGRLLFTSTPRLAEVRLGPDSQIRRLGVEQSNTSIRIEDSAMLKIYRRLTAGAHPEVEMSRFLTEAGFTHAPPLLGTLERIGTDGVSTILMVAQRFVANQGDGWTQTVEHLERRLEDIALASASDAGEITLHDFYIDLFGTLGRRTAELHRALAIHTGDAAFEPEPIDARDESAWRTAARAQAESAFTSLQRASPRLDDAMRRKADALVARRQECIELIDRLGTPPFGASKTRIHGDYHLGQILLCKDDWMIVDFEGEPTKSLEQRLGKASPLRDVAGMLRSFDYASSAALAQLPQSPTPIPDTVIDFASGWREAAKRAYLNSYRKNMAGVESYPASAKAAQRWLDLFVLEKACYEIEYELNNRPDWLANPVAGVEAILDSHAGR
ncbi:MAG TPA: putative maltokinase, partial [Rhodanobacteraceae bacterium]|nr:putative maltokinase [Rhodanobacteraceae bacterium]